MQHTVPFNHANETWEAHIEGLPQTIEMDLENVINDRGAMSADGTAKLMVLRESVKSLYRTTGGIHKPQTLRDSKGNLKLPDYRDEKTFQGIKEPLLKACVKVNNFLGYVEPFKNVFESYLPGEVEEGEERENPTEATDTSQNGSVSSLPSPQPQT